MTKNTLLGRGRQGKNLRQALLEMFSPKTLRRADSLKAGIGAPGGGLPVVRRAGFRNPGRNRYGQIGSHRIHVRLIHLPKLDQLLVGGLPPVKFQADRFQRGAQELQLFRRKAVLLRVARSPVED